MLTVTCSRSCLRSPTATFKFPPFLSPRSNRISCISETLILKMQSQPVSKRPTCPSCSKPISVCLCTRFKNPSLDNKVHVTIIQHSLEKKHPLNSAKIAKLGLRNVDVYSVSDVMFEAQLVIRPFGEDSGFDGECTPSVCENVSRSFGSVGGLDVIPDDGSVETHECPPENLGVIVFGARFDGKSTDVCDDLNIMDAKRRRVEPVLNVTVGRYGKVTAFSHPWKLKDEGSNNTLNFENAITSSEATKCLSRGFVVTKLQKRQKTGSLELEQFEEFVIRVPPGSALLFPAKESTSVDAVDFEVKNLIVLDGTWSKANRIYNENPWLKVLPCVKLEIEKLSLFCEVRREPKPGYLSTIESIVYALEALGAGENVEGLHSLLNVLESMVEDQRRCMNERLKKLSSSS